MIPYLICPKLSFDPFAWFWNYIIILLAIRSEGVWVDLSSILCNDQEQYKDWCPFFTCCQEGSPNTKFRQFVCT